MTLWFTFWKLFLKLSKPGWSAVCLDVQLPSVPLSTEWTKMDNGDSWFMITEIRIISSLLVICSSLVRLCLISFNCDYLKGHAPGNLTLGNILVKFCTIYVGTLKGHKCHPLSDSHLEANPGSLPPGECYLKSNTILLCQGNSLICCCFFSGDRPIHISYDIDSLDPKETPSTGTPGATFVSFSPSQQNQAETCSSYSSFLQKIWCSFKWQCFETRRKLL